MTHSCAFDRTVSGEPEASVLVDDEYPLAPMDKGLSTPGHILALRDE